MKLRLGLTLVLLCGPVYSLADDELPIVPDGFRVEVVAREPLVSNPCVMAFDRLGRIFVGQGQQWRAPTPETPVDSPKLFGTKIAQNRSPPPHDILIPWPCRE